VFIADSAGVRFETLCNKFYIHVQPVHSDFGKFSDPPMKGRQVSVLLCLAAMAANACPLQEDSLKVVSQNSSPMTESARTSERIVQTSDPEPNRRLEIEN
jgi:hypothetical protein